MLKMGTIVLSQGNHKDIKSLSVALGLLIERIGQEMDATELQSIVEPMVVENKDFDEIVEEVVTFALKDDLTYRQSEINIVPFEECIVFSVAVEYAKDKDTFDD